MGFLTRGFLKSSSSFASLAAGGEPGPSHSLTQKMDSSSWLDSDLGEGMDAVSGSFQPLSPLEWAMFCSKHQVHQMIEWSSIEGFMY